MKTIVCLVLLAGAQHAQAQSDRSLLREGNSLYKQEKFADAEINYRKALEKNKQMTQGAFNLGDALYKQGRYDEAAEQYRIAATQQPAPDAQAKALHNLGNTLLKGKKIPESIAAYKEALKLHPNDADTKYNLEYAKALLQQQQQQQQQQKKDDKKQQKQDQQKQDQKKDDQQKQDQQKKEQEKQDQQQQKQEQQKKQQISKADAERILEALKNEEKDVQKKLKKKVPARIRVDKDW